MPILGSGVIPLFWLAFAAIWIFSPSFLGTMLHWIQGQPRWLEIIIWIIFLPWVASLWIWHTSWQLWLRVVLIILIALVTLSGGASGSRRRKR